MFTQADLLVSKISKLKYALSCDDIILYNNLVAKVEFEEKTITVSLDDWTYIFDLNIQHDIHKFLSTQSSIFKLVQTV